jgi:hypothetical protein
MVMSDSIQSEKLLMTQKGKRKITGRKFKIG